MTTRRAPRCLRSRARGAAAGRRTIALADLGETDEGRAFDSLSMEPGQGVNIPDQAILARERAREVEHALAGLSPKLRDVLVLRFAGELSYDEIVELLKLPLGTVKRRIFDRLEKLRLIMDGERKGP